jgi:protein tyrosine phosphatase (PTP) superfamily phosphohydrolase (DUF442 family)
MALGRLATWCAAASIVLMIVVVPLCVGRWHYEKYRRLRVVTDGRVYRSGQLTADGFRAAHAKYGFKTVINLQAEEHAIDPKLPVNSMSKATELESTVMADLGVKYIQIDGGALDDDGANGRPSGIDDFLAICDDEDNYPILLHCKAGLHRTGWLTSVYRREYEGWTLPRAHEELRANGFGTFKSTTDNIYIQRYLFDFVPDVRKPDYPWPKHSVKPPHERKATP